MRSGNKNRKNTRGRGVCQSFRKALWAIILLLLGFAGEVFALDTSLQGVITSRHMGLYDPLYQGDMYGHGSHSARVQARIYPNNSLLLEAAYSLSMSLDSTALPAEAVSLYGPPEHTEFRVIDFNARLFPVEDKETRNLRFLHNLDRLYGSVYLPFGDLYVGRQAISWGSARVINPTDFIVPAGLRSGETENRRGVDALRLRIPLGMMGEADFGYTGGESFELEKSAVFARTKLYIAETDVSFIAADVKENLHLGADAARSIGGAGSWAEAVYVLPGTFSSSGFDTDLHYFNASAGLDYNFGEKLYGYAEYHFNSAGWAQAEDYITGHETEEELEGLPAYSEGAVFLLGRHYAALGGTCQIRPLLPLSSMVLFNLNDLSAYLTASLEYNFTENVYLEAGCLLGIGPGPRIGDGGVLTKYRSEFGVYPGLFYSSVRIYF